MFWCSEHLTSRWHVSLQNVRAGPIVHTVHLSPKKKNITSNELLLRRIANSILIICTTKIDALHSFERFQWRYDASGKKSFLARLERTTSENVNFVQSCNFVLALNIVVFLQRKCVHLGNMWEDVSSSQYPSHARTRTPRPITIGRSARAGCFYYAQDATSHLQTSRPCADTGTVGGCRPAEMQRVHRRGPGKSE